MHNMIPNRIQEENIAFTSLCRLFRAFTQPRFTTRGGQGSRRAGLADRQELKDN